MRRGSLSLRRNFPPGIGEHGCIVNMKPGAHLAQFVSWCQHFCSSPLLPLLDEANLPVLNP